MADTGAVAPGTLASDNSHGSAAWTDASNAASNNDTYATVSLLTDVEVVKLVVGGSVSGDNRVADNAATLPGSETLLDYGGAAVLWGLTPTAAQVKSSDFGCVLAVWDGALNASEYLKATNFDFSAIPAGATINGVKVGYGAFYDSMAFLAKVDYVQMTVYYTAGGVPKLLGKLAGKLSGKL
jgi:hypothetical protein